MKLTSLENATEFLSSLKVVNILAFLAFAIVMSVIISSENFFFKIFFSNSYSEDIGQSQRCLVKKLL